MTDCYSDLITVSTHGKNETYSNHIFIDKEGKGVFSTNGHIILWKRDLFEQVAATSRLIGAEMDMVCKDGALTKVDSERKINASSFFNLSGREKFTLNIPKCLTSFKKTTKNVRSYLTYNNNTQEASLNLNTSKKNNDVGLDLLTLTHCPDEVVDVYVALESNGSVKLDYLVILPKGSTVSDCAWAMVVAFMVD